MALALVKVFCLLKNMKFVSDVWDKMYLKQ